MQLAVRTDVGLQRRVGRVHGALDRCQAVGLVGEGRGDRSYGLSRGQGGQGKVGCVYSRLDGRQARGGVRKPPLDVLGGSLQGHLAVDAVDRSLDVGDLLLDVVDLVLQLWIQDVQVFDDHVTGEVDVLGHLVGGRVHMLHPEPFVVHQGVLAEVQHLRDGLDWVNRKGR